MQDHTPVKMKRFNLLSSEIETAYHDAALKLGLSDSAMRILYTICNIGENCLLSDITHLSGISKQTINSALRKLESDGIVYLEAFNGKQKMVYLTDKGKVLAKDTAFRLIEFENEIFDSWTEEEREIYIELTRRFLTSFKEKIKEL